MANRNRRLPVNAPGAYYVDDSCIDCDLCRSMAPQVFGRHDAGAHSYVHQQPASEEDRRSAESALEACPTETIGRDGE